MTFLDSIKTVVRKYAEFGGKASLPEFWWWILFAVLVTSVFSVFDVIEVGRGSSIGALLSGVWGVVIFLPTLAVSVRRLRDAGYDWTYIFWLLLPIAGAIVLAFYLVKPSVGKK